MNINDDIEEMINIIKWRFDAYVTDYFTSITCLYNKNKIPKKRYEWLIKKRPHELFDELFNKYYSDN
ncbi:MAG: hypothetical protein PVJ67_03930 [Candidatus Pacearchaeota archaeon]|jgi:hypothetical protein